MMWESYDIRAAVFVPAQVRVLRSAFEHACWMLEGLGCDAEERLAKLVINRGRGRLRVGLTLADDYDASEVAALVIDRMIQLALQGHADAALDVRVQRFAQTSLLMPQLAYHKRPARASPR